jgi:hypothetical protein
MAVSHTADHPTIQTDTEEHDAALIGRVAAVVEICGRRNLRVT